MATEQDNGLPFSGGRSSEKSSSSNGVWIIVAVVAGGLLLVILCLYPLLLRAREAARRSQCRYGNLMEISRALQDYHSQYNSFPPAFVADENGVPMHSWRVLILPMLGQQSLYDQYDFAQPWDSPANQHVLDNMPKVFDCPAGDGGNTTSYAGVFGPNCVFTGAEGVRSTDIPDGAANTIMVGEVEESDIPWTKPEDIDISKHPGIGQPGGFNSNHSGGAHFLWCDGQMYFLQENTNPQTLQNLFTRNDGQVIDSF